MKVAESQLFFYCNRSIVLYSEAIKLAEKANLADIFNSLKDRRLKLLRIMERETTDGRLPLPPAGIDNLPDLLIEIKSNEEQLIEVSTKILKNRRGISSRLKEFVRSSVTEIRSSLHWLDIISSYYKTRRVS